MKPPSYIYLIKYFARNVFGTKYYTYSWNIIFIISLILCAKLIPHTQRIGTTNIETNVTNQPRIKHTYYFIHFVLSSFFIGFVFHPATPYFVRPSLRHALRYFACRSTQFETQDGSSDSTLSPYTESLASSSHLPMSSPNYSTSPSYSPSQQNYPVRSSHHQQPYYPPYRHYENPTMRNDNMTEPVSPELLSPTSLDGQKRQFGSSLNVNASNSPQLSPVFKSEAAKQIIKEMTEKKVEGPRRRQIPREKRRHYTVSSSKPVLDLEDTFSKMVSFLFFFFFVFYVFVITLCLPSIRVIVIVSFCSILLSYRFIRFGVALLYFE